MQNLPCHLEARLHSEKLQAVIKKACQTQGQLSFKTFMKMALYEPGLGYYSAGQYKLGAQGDFVTAPEISPLFGQSLSFAFDHILSQLSHQAGLCILELGAGTGKLAGDILESLTYLPHRYFILDVSADLIKRQQDYLKKRLSPALFERIEWLTHLPPTFKGIIVANEVIDAMPVHKIKVSSNEGRPHLEEYYVKYDKTFQWTLVPATDEIKSKLDLSSIAVEGDYVSEINSDLEPWLGGLSECLEEGVMIFIDYGFPAHEYYHPDRAMGTLMAHYQHHVHFNVFEKIGLCDITAHVDFTALAKAALKVHLDVAGFTTQGAYLLDNQLAQLAENAFQKASSDPTYPYRIAQHIQQLTAPHEMGELFKVMALSKNFKGTLTGFTLRDHRMRL